MSKTTLALLASACLVLAGCSGNSGNSGTSPIFSANCEGAAVSPERLFLQMLTDTSVIVKWRGNQNGGAEATNLCFGTDMNALPAESRISAVVTATGHSEAQITGLDPDTTYYYSVGGAGSAAPEHSFTTAPIKGSLPSDGNTRIWIVGDSGVASTDKTGAYEVRDGFKNWVANNGGGEKADLFLMLGDSAYDEGTDKEHQIAVFETYPEILATTPVWPTIGNHEMGTFGVSTSSDPNTYAVVVEDNGTPDPPPDSPFPYLNIFTLPTAAEAGGVASSTEQYYSFDFANVHVVSLDSQLSARDEAGREAMRQWLIDDLSANTQAWTVVIFHHPPYSKASHDSDNPLGGIDQPMIDMREQFTPVFEDYGVDVVYGGHSHAYERSHYLNGHTGLSDTFDPAIHAELNSDGTMASGQGDQAYRQITNSGADDKVVYTVAGHSGKLDGSDEITLHPAHYVYELALGSVVIDANDERLIARSVGTSGEERDFFTITR